MHLTLVAAGVVLTTAVVLGARAEAAPYLVIQHGHTSTISAAVVSSDGRFAVTAGLDSSVRVWELASGRLLEKLDNDDPVLSVALSPSDKHKLAIGDSSGRVRLFSLATQTELDPLEDCTGPVRALAFSPSGNELLAVCPSRQAAEGSKAQGAMLWRFDSSGEGSTDANVIELAERVLAASFVRGTEVPSVLFALSKGLVQDFDPIALAFRPQPFANAVTKERAPAPRTANELPGIESAAFASGAPIALAAGTDGEVCVLAPPERPRSCAKLISSGVVVASALSEEAARGAIASAGGEVCVFDTALETKADGSVACLATRRFDRPVRALAFAPDDRLLVASGNSALLWEWHARDQPDVVLAGSNPRGQTFALSRSGRWLFTANGPNVLIWDLDLGRPTARVPLVPGQEIRSASWSTGGESGEASVLALVFGDGTLRMWSRDKSGFVGPPIKFELFDFWRLAWTADGKELIAGNADGSLRRFFPTPDGFVLAARTPTERTATRGCPLVSLEPIAASGAGAAVKRVLAATGDGQISTWELGDKATRTVISPAFGIGCPLVAASPRANGGALAVTREGQVLRWKPETRGGKKTLVKDLVEEVGPAPINVSASFSEASLLLVTPARGAPALFAAEGRPAPVDRGGQFERMLSAAVRKNATWMLEPDGELVIAGKDRTWTASLLTHADGSWAVIDKQNRIDASGDVPGVHWVDELQAMTLRQLEGDPCAGPLWPGLLAVRLGRRAESASLPKALPELVRPPQMGEPFLAMKNTVAKSCAAAEVIPLRRLGDPLVPVLCIPFESGARGQVAIALNGRPLPQRLDIADDYVAFDLSASLDVAKQGSNLIDAEVTSTLGVVASAQWSASEEVRGQRSSGKSSAARALPAKDRFFALVVGVDDYQGGLQLSYTHHDARDLSGVLRAIAAPAYDEVNVKCIAATKACEGRGTKQEIERAFAWLAENTSRNDVVVIYLAGHGDVAMRCNSPSYYFLTAGAGTSALTDANQRAKNAISAKQLEELMIRVRADRKLLILETCKAGASLQMHWPLGTIVLAANGADAASYGSGKLSHGYLAHAVLEKLHTSEVRDSNGKIDVWKLIASAGERASARARDDGKLESPLLTTQNIDLKFDLGKVDASNEAALKCIRALPAVYYAAGAGLEGAGLGKKIGLAFRTSPANAVVFRDTDTHGDAKYKITATAKSAEGRTTVGLTVEQDGEAVVSTAIASRPGEDSDVFAARVAGWVIEWIKTAD